MSPTELEALRAFRHQVYMLCGCRHDALFELVDAVLTVSAIETPAQMGRCAALEHRPELVRSTACFHWWPRRVSKLQHISPT